MKITVRQAWVLDNLYRIVVEHKGRMTRYMLDGEDCRLQIVSLGAKKIVHRSGRGQPVKIAEPEGLMRDGWANRHGEVSQGLVPAAR